MTRAGKSYIFKAKKAGKTPFFSPKKSGKKTFLFCGHPV